MMRAPIALAALPLLLSGPALAAGYGLKEQNAAAMGTAYAGSAATDRDAGSLTYNPASLAGVADADFAISAVEILPQSSADYSVATTAAGTPASGTRTPHGFISDGPVPNLALRYRLSDVWALGLSVSVPYGLKTNYPQGWAGRYYGLKSSAATLDIAPALSWQVTPTLALGASAQFEYARGLLTSAIDIGSIGASLYLPGSVPGALDGTARLSGMDWAEGFSLGLLDHVTPDLALGVSYQSAITHNLRGPLTFTLDGAGLGAAIRGATGLFTDTRGSAKLTTPDMILVGLSDRLDDRWTLLAEFDWTNWSRFHTLTAVAQNPAQPNDVTVANWNNAVFASLGAAYRLNDVWGLRGGVGYDQSPVPDATRSPRIPDADRVWLAAGIDYAVTPGTRLNLSVGHLFNSDETIAQTSAQTGNSLRGNLTGVTRSSVTTVGLALTGTL
jgi:long-chain fatty acid transport protein